ncbi:hypothetical protein KEM56_002034 [Ascosphaera pollenicola]|nr:hypothetical protein KEM56_002034 [Ascosphaera pollenicola]
MPHADSSFFAPGLTKAQTYEQVLEQATGLMAGSRHWVSNLSNAASLLWHAYASLPAPSSHVNWAGFYVREDKLYRSAASTEQTSTSSKKDLLVLGPFQGKPACQAISFGKGVCGVAAKSKTTTLVADVDTFPGHIACDGESKSEIVVPILVEGEVVAIIDIDCTVESGFDIEDSKGLEALAAALAQGCDW